MRRSLPPRALFFPAVQAGDSERVGCPGGFGKASAFHPLEHFFGRRETLDRRGEIGVGTADARNHGSHAGQNLLEIEAVERAHDSAGLTEVEDAAFPARAQYADDLAQSCVVVGEITETESRSDKIKVRCGKRKVQGVGFDPTWHGISRNR